MVKTRKLFKFFILVSLIKATYLQALSNQELERITAFVRAPVVIGANVILTSNGPTKLKQGMLIAADLVRLCNEALSIINKQGKYDFHYHDYCWALYDGISLIYHLGNIFVEDNDRVDDEFLDDELQFRGLSKILHEWILPCVEGITAFLVADYDGVDLGDANFRSKCKTINSISRLLDGIVKSKPKSKEKYAYICVLVIVIVSWYMDFLWFENAFKEEEMRKEEEKKRYPPRRNIPPIQDILAALNTQEAFDGPIFDELLGRDRQENFEEDQTEEPDAGDDVDPNIIYMNGGCGICQNGQFAVDDRTVRFNCGHLFCENCIQRLNQYERIRRNCPTCQNPRHRNREREIVITQDMLDQNN